MARIHSGVLFFLLITACGGASHGPNTGPLVYDSAGVRVVVYPSPRSLSSLPEWSTGAPTLRLSLPVSASPFYSVRSAARAADGRTLVVNGGSSEVLVFSPEGRFENAVGGPGGGPGEFRLLAGAHWVTSDTIVIYDAQKGRLMWFAASGQLVDARTVAWPPGPVGPGLKPVGWTGDGQFIAVHQVLDQSRSGMEADGATRTSYRDASLVFISQDGEVSTSVDGFRGDERAISVAAPADGILRLRSGATPFLKTFEASVRGYHVVVGSTAQYTVSWYNPDGKLTQVLRIEAESRPVTNGLIREWVDHRLSGIEDRAAAATQRTALMRLDFPSSLPMFSRLMLDADGALWIRDYVLPQNSTAENWWTVFDSTGQGLARVGMPAQFTPLDLGREDIVGVLRDGLDVEQVVLLPIVR